MADQQERLNKIASTFGATDIKIYIGRDKVFPDKSVSEAKMQQLENGLRSPQDEQSSIRVTEANQTIYRSQAGAVTADVKGVAAAFQSPTSAQTQVNTSKLSYYDLLLDYTNKVQAQHPGALYDDKKFTPEFVDTKLNAPGSVQASESFGKSIDRMVLTEAIGRGVGKDEAIQLVKEQSPYFASLSQDQHRFPKAFSDYANPEGGLLSREFDSALTRHQESIQTKEVALPEVSIAQAEIKPIELTNPQPSIPLLDLSAFVNGKLSEPVLTKDEQIRAAVEPKLLEQISQIKAPVSVDLGGAIVLAQSKALIPLEPTFKQLNEKMPEILSPQPVAVNKTEPIVSTPQPVAAKAEPVASVPNKSLEKALAVANSRIDSLQTQLNTTQGALEDLSKHVKESNLKTWATNTAQKIGTTFQTIATQAKTKLVDWVTQAKATVGQKATQVKKAAKNTVGNVKTAAQDKAERVKTATQLKTIEVRETARHRINDVLSPVDSAALTATANRAISEWGKDGKFEGNTFNFQRSQSGDVSIYTKDGAAVFANGVVTDKASPQTIAHLSQLPRRMEVTQNYNPTQTPSMKREFAR